MTIKAQTEPKPTVPQVLPLVRSYLAQPGNEVGGSLHIVLDDGNVADHHVQFCHQWALDHDDTAGAELATILLRMSKTQRSKLYRLT